MTEPTNIIRPPPGADFATADNPRPGRSGLDISPKAYQEFCILLERASGIVLGGKREYLVVSRLRGLIQELGLAGFDELVTALQSGVQAKVGHRIVEAMTTNETSWFRDGHPFDALRERILPELLRSRNRINLWSAACSSGQEPYSMAMVLAELRRSNPAASKAAIEILGTDLSGSMIESATRGVYDQLAIRRGLPDEYRERYFRRSGDHWEVVPALRSAVRFRCLNLLHDFRHLGAMDVVFCRNILIYFSAEVRRSILDRVLDLLRPGGYLVLGGAESLPCESPVLERLRHGGGLIYRRLARST